MSVYCRGAEKVPRNTKGCRPWNIETRMIFEKVENLGKANNKQTKYCPHVFPQEIVPGSTKEPRHKCICVIP